MAFLKLKSLFLLSILLVVLFILHLAVAADSQVASLKVQYKKNIILYCGDGPQYDQKFAKDNIVDKDDEDDDDDDDDHDDDDEDDGDDDDERKKNLWKDVQFFRTPPKSANASEADAKSSPELIVPDGKQFIFNPKRNSLKIHYPKRAEIESSYFCNSSAPQKTISFQFLILPYLYMPEFASYSHFEGDNETLHCKALFGLEGDQTLEWKWKYGDKVLETEGNSTTVEVKKDTHESLLTIQNLDDKQKGRYKCIVSNKHGSHSRTIILRIKERYGFLWPLIGSLIVLVLLVLVIIFAEMRQRRKERKQRAD